MPGHRTLYAVVALAVVFSAARGPHAADRGFSTNRAGDERTSEDGRPALLEAGPQSGSPGGVRSSGEGTVRPSNPAATAPVNPGPPTRSPSVFELILKANEAELACRLEEAVKLYEWALDTLMGDGINDNTQQDMIAPLRQKIADLKERIAKGGCHKPEGKGEGGKGEGGKGEEGKGEGGKGEEGKGDGKSDSK